MRHEWDRLAPKGTYDFRTVKESYQVRADAKLDQKTIHIGLVFGIVGEKQSELKEDDPLRIIKGRYCFQGNEVRDE